MTDDLENVLRKLAAARAALWEYDETNDDFDSTRTYLEGAHAAEILAVGQARDAIAAKRRKAVTAANNKRAAQREANRLKAVALAAAGKQTYRIAKEMQLSERYVRELLSQKSGADRR